MASRHVIRASLASVALLIAAVLASTCAVPNDWLDEDLNPCSATCHGGCGTIGDCHCGGCGEGEACYAWECHDCKALCAGTECGMADEWGPGSACDCGECEMGKPCFDGVCQECDLVCKNVACGMMNGCDCGGCPVRHECNSDHVCECVPNCTDADGNAFECGDDGCGGDCGFCSYGECVDRMCFCEPDCAGKVCGDDGCNGSCGACSEDLLCHQGQCIERCGDEAVSGMETVQKYVMLRPGIGSVTGQALNIDEDLTTCFPEEGCEGGGDNVLGAFLYQMADSWGETPDIQMDRVLQQVGLSGLLHFPEPVVQGAAFDVVFLAAHPKAPQNVCDYMSEPCDYWVLDSGLAPVTCTPRYVMSATYDGEWLIGGSKETVILMPNQLIRTDAAVYLMPAYMGHLKARPVFEDGVLVELEQGILAGALRKADLIAALQKTPDGAPVSSELLTNLLDMFLTPDMDTDGDGQLDAVSAAYVFHAVRGTVTGTAAAPEFTLP